MGKGLRRTLGEEYVEIGITKENQVVNSDNIYDSDYYKDEVTRFSPGILHKLVFILCRTLIPYAFSKLSHYRTKISQNKTNKTW